MIVVNTHEAKTNLSALLKQIEFHHEIVRLCRNGRPIADIVPIEDKAQPLEQHACLQKGAKILYDPSLPLSEDEWPQGEC